jgi:hypothetical protein
LSSFAPRPHALTNHYTVVALSRYVQHHLHLSNPVWKEPGLAKCGEASSTWRSIKRRGPRRAEPMSSSAIGVSNARKMTHEWSATRVQQQSQKSIEPQNSGDLVQRLRSEARRMGTANRPGSVALGQCARTN